MYRIKIKGKGLPKAQYQNSQMGDDEQLSPIDFRPPKISDDLFLPEDLSKQLDKEKKEFNTWQQQQNAAIPGFMQPPSNLDEVDKQYRSDPNFQFNYDVSLLGAQPNRGMTRKYNQFFGKKYNIDVPTPLLGPKVGNWLNKQQNKIDNWALKNRRNIQKAGRIAGVADTLGTIGSAAADFIGNRQRQKAFDKAFRQNILPDNMYAVSAGDDRGDFDINEGIYQPNRLTPPNVGAYYGAKYGGTQTNDMNKIKIKIKSSPDMMEYGGQQRKGMSLGLDLGQRNVYRDMPKEKSEHVRDTIPEVSRSQANIEAERGETVYGDLDGDGALEHLKIGGKRHTEGGTPLNVPEGSFIFSDTKKMIIKDPVILERFGMKPRKEGYTPAEIAKKYDVNKYKAIMEDPNIDPVRKSTAQLMIKNFQRKLAELALIQEGMKGFPQGVPKVARETLPEAEQLAQSMEQEQVMEQGPTVEQQEGMAPPMGEQPYPEDEQMMEQEEMAAMEQPQQMSQEQMMEEQPEMGYGGYMPMYQGQQGSSTTGQFVPGIYPPQSQQPAPYVPGMSTTPPDMSMQDLQTKYPWFKPYTQSKTKSGRISRTTGKSTLFDPSTFSQYNDIDYWVQKAKQEGKDIKSIKDLQQYVYPIIEQQDPSVIQQMWTEFGPTLQSNERNLQNFADNLAGARTAFVFGKRPGETPEDPGAVIGYLCVDGKVQSSSYKDYQAVAAAGAKLTYPEAAVGCTPGTPPGTIKNSYNLGQRHRWMTPDKVNLLAAAAVPPKKYLPFAAPIPYEPNRLSLEDWRAQAAAEQSMYNKQAETMGVYGPTTGQAANQSFAAGQQAERVGNVISGVTSRNVDRVNQYLGQERARKDQFNLLGAERATNLFDKNVIANQNYDNARRAYINNLAKTFGQGWQNAMKLGMLNAVNPRYKVDPISGASYYTGAGFGTNRLGMRTAGYTLDDFATLKSQNLARGMSDAMAESQALKQINASNSSGDDSSGFIPQYTFPYTFPG